MYYPTSSPALVVDITVKHLKGGKVKAIGKGINPADDTEYTELGSVSSKVVNKIRTQNAINEARGKLEALYFDRYGLGPADEKAMLAAFEQLKRKVLEEGFRLTPSWRSPSTNKAAIIFFGSNTLPLLLPFADPGARMFLASDRDEIESELTAAAKQRRRDDDSDAGARIRAVNRLREADIVYAHMRDVDDRLPDLKLSPDGPSIRVPLNEQVKSLPREILMRFFARLYELIEQFPRQVFYAVFVVFGLRPAEAAARKPCDIKWHSTFCTAEVSSQERGGKCDPRLKNEYSRRPIIISYWGMCLLERCCEVIGDDYSHDDTAMNNAVECSRWVKNLLLECGAAEADIETEGAAIEDDDLDTEDTDLNTPEDNKRQKIVSYVLRRIFASTCRSVMGLTSFETDRLMGHKPIGVGSKKEDKQRHPDLNTDDTQKAIATRMERFIHDPRFSLNPAAMPYTVSGKDHLDIIEFSEVIIENDGDHDVALELTIDGVETGEFIIIEMPLGTEYTLTHSSIPKSWDGYDRTVIGDTTIPKVVK